MTDQATLAAARARAEREECEWRVGDEDQQVTPGVRARAARVALGYTVTELAWLTGADKATVSRLENDRCMLTAASLLPIARTLGVSVEYLLTGENPPAEDPRVPALQAEVARLRQRLRSIWRLAQPEIEEGE